MKLQYVVALVLTAIALTVSLQVTAATTVQIVQNTVTETEYVPKGLTSAQVIWLAKLMNCESRITEKAVNPKDLDNTPSYGILQFKDSTFRAFAVKYGIKETDYMNPEAQVEIVTHWLLNPKSIDWTHQFPDCVHRLGLPPQP